ncbi:hypothetical protein Tco_1378219 [Tanacetum coccineum]
METLRILIASTDATIRNLGASIKTWKYKSDRRARSCKKEGLEAFPALRRQTLETKLNRSQLLKLVFLRYAKDKDEGKSHAGTLIDIPVFVENFSIITGFTIIDSDDITQDVVLGMKFCKKYASCQMIMKKCALGDKCERIMEDE